MQQLREILFICVVGLIPAQGKPVILEGEFTFKLLELKRSFLNCLQMDPPLSSELKSFAFMVKALCQVIS